MDLSKEAGPATDAAAPDSQPRRFPPWSARSEHGKARKVDLSMVARVLWLRRQLRGHERWSSDELERHRRAELERLRRFARSRSAFYRTFHQGLDRAPLTALPPLTKADLM